MQAAMITDEYMDITPGYTYEVDRVYKDGRIRLVNSPRIYDGRHFEIRYKGKRIDLKKAYRQYRWSRKKWKQRGSNP